MILALDYSYTSAVVDVSRVGIGRYLKLLLNSIFMADPNFKLEAWSYDFNSVCIKNFLQDLYEKYPDKISFFL